MKPKIDFKNLDFNKMDFSQFDLTRKHDEHELAPDEGINWWDHFLLIAISSLFVIFLLWASFAEIEEVTRGEGKVIPSSEVQVIQNLEGGIIEEILVKEGQEVKEGEVVLRMRDVDAASDYGSNKAEFMGLKTAIIRLQAEAEGKQVVEFPQEIIDEAPEAVQREMEAFRANRDQKEGQLMVLKQQLSQREQEVAELRKRTSDLTGVIDLARQQKSMVEPLVSKGSASKMELLDLERNIAERTSELNGLKLALPRSQSAAEEVRARIKEQETMIRAEARQELALKTTQMKSIGEKLSSLSDRKSRTEVRSLRHGTVKDIKINTIGGVVRPGEVIMEIVPLGEQLLVEAHVRPKDIAFLHPGQEAMVKITAYDFSIYGSLKGKLVDISADTIQNEKGESFYRVKVLTEESTLKRKGEILPIIPGMTTSVDIKTGEKTIMDYLLKPFKKAAYNAMRER